MIEGNVDKSAGIWKAGVGAGNKMNEMPKWTIKCLNLNARKHSPGQSFVKISNSNKR